MLYMRRTAHTRDVATIGSHGNGQGLALGRIPITVKMQELHDGDTVALPIQRDTTPTGD